MIEQFRTTADLRTLFPERDHAWVEKAILEMMTAGVARPAVEAALTEAAAARDAAESSDRAGSRTGAGPREGASSSGVDEVSAADVHGPAQDWAAGRLAEWRVGGDDVWAEVPRPTVRSVGVSGLLLATALAMTFAFAEMTSSEPGGVAVTAGRLLLPTAAGLLGGGAWSVYEWLLGRRSRIVAAVGAAAVAIAGAALCGVLVFATETHVWWVGDARVYVASALANLALAGALWWVSARRASRRTAVSTCALVEPDDPAGWGDEEWLRECGRILRRSKGYREARVRSTLAEARAHAAAAGAGLGQEFGAPAAYVASLPDGALLSLRGRTAWWVGLIVGWVALAYYRGLNRGGWDAVDALGMGGFMLVMAIADVLLTRRRRRRAAESA